MFTFKFKFSRDVSFSHGNSGPSDTSSNVDANQIAVCRSVSHAINLFVFLHESDGWNVYFCYKRSSNEKFSEQFIVRRIVSCIQKLRHYLYGRHIGSTSGFFNRQK